MKLKFKVGDRVIPINNKRNEYGQIQIIKLIDSNSYSQPYRTVRGMWYFEEDLISEEIWNSPLYQALKEE